MSMIDLREDSLVYDHDIDVLPNMHDGIQQLISQFLSERQEDIIGEFRDLVMDETAHLMYNDKAYAYNRHSLSQAVTRIKPIGVRELISYMVACPPTLRYINYDYWHNIKYRTNTANSSNIKGNKVMLRTMQANGMLVLRAIVSHLYSSVDDPIVLDHLNKIIPSGAKLSLKRGDRQSRYGIFWPSEKTALAVGDDAIASIKVINSETGASSIKLRPMAFSQGYNAWFAIPYPDKEVLIRHIGEATSKLTREYGRVATFIEPFMERLKASYVDDFNAPGRKFKDEDDMFKAFKSAFDLATEDVLLIKDTYLAIRHVNKASRYGVATAIAQAASTLSIDKADLLHEAAGQLIVKGWRFIEKYIHEDDDEASDGGADADAIAS